MPEFLQCTVIFSMHYGDITSIPIPAFKVDTLVSTVRALNNLDGKNLSQTMQALLISITTVDLLVRRGNNGRSCIWAYLLNRHI